MSEGYFILPQLFILIHVANDGDTHLKSEDIHTSSDAYISKQLCFFLPCNVSL